MSMTGKDILNAAADIMNYCDGFEHCSDLCALYDEESRACKIASLPPFDWGVEKEEEE